MRQHHLDMVSVPLTDEALASADAVLVTTDHSAFDYGRVVAHSRLVVDTRNACRAVKVGREKIVKA
jgi:UDP-N-acetyl-D-glucosamine dehydrogenase